MQPTSFRDAVLKACTSTDAQSPFVSPTQLADALNTFMQHLLGELGMRHRKAYAGIEDLKRMFNISTHHCKKVLTTFNIPFKTTATGLKRYDTARFEKALTQVI